MAIIVPTPRPPSRKDIRLPTPDPTRPPGPDPAAPPPPPDPTTLPQARSLPERLTRDVTSLVTGVDPDASPTEQARSSVMQGMAPGVAGLEHLAGPAAVMVSAFRDKVMRQLSTDAAMAKFTKLFDDLGWSERLKARAMELLNAHPRVAAHVLETNPVPAWAKGEYYGAMTPRPGVPPMRTGPGRTYSGAAIELGGGTPQEYAAGQLTEDAAFSTLFEEFYHAAQQIGLKDANLILHKAWRDMFDDKLQQYAFTPVEQSVMAAKGPRGIAERARLWRSELQPAIPPEAAGRVVPMYEAVFGEGVVDTVRDLLRQGRPASEIVTALVKTARKRGTTHAAFPEGLSSKTAKRLPLQQHYTRASGRRRGRSPGVDAPGVPPPPKPPAPDAE